MAAAYRRPTECVIISPNQQHSYEAGISFPLLEETTEAPETDSSPESHSCAGAGLRLEPGVLSSRAGQ